MTIPAKYTLTEAHMKIAELEKERHELKNKLAVQKNWQTLYEKLILEIEDQAAEPAEFVI